MENRQGSHSVYCLQVHIVWITKYRYHVLQGDVQHRCRDILRQICNALDIKILKGALSKDHVHMHISYPPKLSISDVVKRFKGRSSRLLLQEFPELHRKYWGCHFWGIGYGCWSTGNVTEEMISAYLEHHNETPNSEENFVLG
jgi:putative transposase